MFLTKLFKKTRTKVMVALAGLTMVFGAGAAISSGVAAATNNEVVETKAATVSKISYKVEIVDIHDWAFSVLHLWDIDYDSVTLSGSSGSTKYTSANLGTFLTNMGYTSKNAQGTNQRDAAAWYYINGSEVYLHTPYYNQEFDGSSRKHYAYVLPSWLTSFSYQYTNLSSYGTDRSLPDGENNYHKVVTMGSNYGEWLNLAESGHAESFTSNSITIQKKTTSSTLGSVTQTSNISEFFNPAIPDQSGYVFIGWYTNSGLSTPYALAFYKATATIYAKYAPQNFTVTGTASTGVSSVYFSASSTATSGSESSFAMDSTVYCFAVLKAGYQARDGWALVAGTANTEGAKYRVASGTVTTSGYAFGPISALAQSYNITIDQREGTGTTSTDYTFSTDSQNVNLGTPTKEGKDFAGYVIDTQPSGGTATIAGAVLTIPGGAYGNIALHATWSDGTYTITFNANGGDASAPSSMNPGVGLEVDLPNYTGTKTGYTFTGWNTASDGSGDHYDVGECTPEVAKGGSLDLFAEWSINSHTVSATAGDGVSSIYFSTSSTATEGAGTSFSYGVTVYAFAVKKAGWTAPNSWTLISGSKYCVASHEMPDDDYSFETINATAASFDITYNTDGGAAIAKSSYTMRATSQNVTLTTPTKTGHTFTGYTITTDTSGSSSSISSKTTLTIPADAYGAITVRANWSTNSYTITYKDKGGADFSGSHGTGYPTSYTYGSGATLDTPTKNGYTFGGYYADSACTGAQVTAVGTTEAVDKVFYAKWVEYQDFWISFDGGTTKQALNTVSAASGTELYQLSTATTLTVFANQSITFWRGNSSASAVAYTASDGLSAESAATNNVVTTDGTWKVHNYASGVNVYFKVYADSSDYTFYLGGKSDSMSTATHGVNSGDVFYIQDRLLANGQATNFGDGGAQLAVYFYDAVGETTSVHAWTTSFCVRDASKSSDEVDVYSVEVPSFSGRSMKWGGAIVLRFASDMTVDNLEEHGMDWCLKDNNNPNMKNGVNPGHFDDDAQNCIQIQYWWGESLSGGYNAKGNYTMYTDAGLMSGQGIYVDPTNAWGGWNFSGDTEDYHIYGYFFNIVNGSGEANVWSSAATKVPGSANLWELETPQYDGEDVEWGRLIIVYAPSASWSTEQNKYQTQDLWYSSALRTHVHITFTGNSTGELKSEASHDAAYTDATRAESWGTRFNASITCSGDGSNDADATKWTALKNEYDAAPRFARDIIKNSSASPAGTQLEKAVSKYDDIIYKYGTDAGIISKTYNDFVARRGTPNYSGGAGYARAIPGAPTGKESPLTMTLWIVLGCGIAGLGAIGAAYFVSKKKKRPQA